MPAAHLVQIGYESLELLADALRRLPLLLVLRVPLALAAPLARRGCRRRVHRRAQPAMQQL